MILKGDCLEVLKAVKDNTIDSLVTDPPYGINFMGKSWDDFSKGQEKMEDMKKQEGFKSQDQPYLNQNHPIYKFDGMQQFFTPIWKEVYRVMKPGSFGFICCIPRQDCLSRMMISLEDAGFNINFTSLYWTYATGFPKALNIGKAVDKRLGCEREMIRKKLNGDKDYQVSGFSKICSICGCTSIGPKGLTCGHPVDSGPSTKEAAALEGSYGGFQPKPAVEVIIVVMKPRSEPTYVDQALTNGKGVVWFDDCRIPYRDDDTTPAHIEKYKDGYGDPNTKPHFKVSASEKMMVGSPNGRFPANLLVSDDVLDDGKNHESVKPKIDAKNVGGWNNQMKINPDLYPGDSGGYSRFFSLDAWAEKNVPFLIVPKASKSEKNMGLAEIQETKLYNRKKDGKSLIEKPNAAMKNNHPTVKPMKLMSYLITMGSRPGDVILDPFAGSGTTGCAAISLDRNFILIEKEEEYIEIIKARIKHFMKEPLKF